jgi:hypothetical protein
MNSGVMLFRRTAWMRSFLESVAALGRIPEPELGQVRAYSGSVSACLRQRPPLLPCMQPQPLFPARGPIMLASNPCCMRPSLRQQRLGKYV